MTTGRKSSDNAATKPVADGMTGQPSPTPAATPANDTGASVVDQDALPLAELARAVLAREVRPRVSSVRRLAEAVLEAESAPAAKSGGKGKAKAGADKPGKKKKKKKKLAKIPGQKKK